MVLYMRITLNKFIERIRNSIKILLEFYYINEL